MIFRKLNNIFGWFVFLIAAITYTLCLEPSVSFWDCGEWISTSYKLEIGHPPGAPVYQLFAHIFSWFSVGDVQNVAWAINLFSAITSAFCVLFLFWTISLLLQKFLDSEKNKFTILISSAIGALAFCFSDSFWFSAVESEVYAFSSMLTAILFWAILRWSNDFSGKNPYSSRWILLICLLLGVSEGVHFLSLLVIPSIVLVIYYQKTKAVWWKNLIAFISALCILLLVYKGLIPITFKIFAKANLFFVNTARLSVNTGIILTTLAFVLVLAIGILVSKIRRTKVLEFCFVGLSLFFIGLSFNFIVIIRSQAGPPINEGKPDNPVSFYSYWQREQYTQPPIFYGQWFSAPVVGYTEKHPQYEVDSVSGKEYYKIVDTGKNASYSYDDDFCTIFPRMWKKGADEQYRIWTLNHGDFVDYQGTKIYKPSFLDNIEFFAGFQLWHSCLRYLMWNFCGKFDDNQGFGSIQKGFVVTGIPFVDKLINGTTKSNIPQNLKNKGRNEYYLLPFILGIIGIFYHFSKDRNNAWVVCTMFVITSIGLVFFLNSAPYEPRERDYVFVLSFYIFAMWIGFGAMSVFAWLEKLKSNIKDRLKIPVAIVLLCIPTLMAFQNWDDHNRSGRFIARDTAYNILQSCEKNSILFTLGDNDTFPLWYIQEVEGFRTDVRIINLNLLSTSWYIEQCTHPVPNNKAITLSFDKKQYEGRNRQLTFSNKLGNNTIPLKELISFVANDSNATNYVEGLDYFYIDASYITIPVNAENFKKQSKFGTPRDFPTEIEVSLPKNIARNDLIHYDIILHNDWNRPIFYSQYATASVPELQKFLQQEGLAYRLTPFEHKLDTLNDSRLFAINKDAMFYNVMNNFSWNNINEVYVDEIAKRFINMTLEGILKLSDSLLSDNPQKAILLWQKVSDNIPPQYIKHKFTIAMIEAYWKNSDNRGDKIMEDLICNIKHENSYYYSLGSNRRIFVKNELYENAEAKKQIALLIQKYNKQTFYKKLLNL